MNNESFASGYAVAQSLLSMWRANLHATPIAALNELITYASTQLEDTGRATDFERGYRAYLRGELAYCKAVIEAGQQWESQINWMLNEQNNPNITPEERRDVGREMGKYILRMEEQLDSFTVQFVMYSKGITLTQMRDYKWSYFAKVLKYVDEQNKPAQTNEEAA